MSGGMIVNLEELEQFIATLRLFNDDLADSLQKLSANFARLGDVWKDAKYQEFAEKWYVALVAITYYLDEGPEQVDFLQRKAAAIADFLH